MQKCIDPLILPIKYLINRKKIKGKKKYFCIGRNKTGTTSLSKAFIDLGFVLGHQRTAERLLKYYKNDNFQPLIKYCDTAQVFQDAPFSYPETFKHLDRAFPDCKFILTVRDDAETWYESLVNFHSILFGNNQVPSAQDLKNAKYVWRGFMWESNRCLYNTPISDPYNKKILIEHYNNYNANVLNYFSDRPDKLLVLNIKKDNAYNAFCDFINVESPYEKFPWINKTADFKVSYDSSY